MRKKLLGIYLIEDLKKHIGIKQECIMAGHARVFFWEIVTCDPKIILELNTIFICSSKSKGQVFSLVAALVSSIFSEITFS